MPATLTYRWLDGAKCFGHAVVETDSGQRFDLWELGLGKDVWLVKEVDRRHHELSAFTCTPEHCECGVPGCVHLTLLAALKAGGDLV